MKAVIFAAGKGTRLGSLTKNIPKPLLKINNSPILEHTLLSLPLEITEVIMIVGYLGDKIKNYFGDDFNGRKIVYVRQDELLGTAYALRLARQYLKNEEKFMVLNADDIYKTKDLKRCMNDSLVFGVCNTVNPSGHFWTIKVDGNNVIEGMEKPLDDKKKRLIGTGVYVLDKRIFRFKPVKIKNGNEYGLPQTIFKMAKKYTIKAFLMDSWLPINTLYDLRRVKKQLTVKN